jgi:hypothetical protein
LVRKRAMAHVAFATFAFSFGLAQALLNLRKS